MTLPQFLIDRYMVGGFGVPAVLKQLGTLRQHEDV
jgi:hypothetical protein